jgi:hypothetical protein
VCLLIEEEEECLYLFPFSLKKKKRKNSSFLFTDRFVERWGEKERLGVGEKKKDIERYCVRSIPDPSVFYFVPFSFFFFVLPIIIWPMMWCHSQTQLVPTVNEIWVSITVLYIIYYVVWYILCTPVMDEKKRIYFFFISFVQFLNTGE